VSVPYLSHREISLGYLGKILPQIIKRAISHDTRTKYRYRTVTILPRGGSVRRNCGYIVAAVPNVALSMGASDS